MMLNITGEADAPPAGIRIAYSNLPPESRRKLDDAMRSWAEWHANKYLPGYVPPEVTSGTLAYAPAQLHLGQASDAAGGGAAGSGDGAAGSGGGALFVFEDRPAAPAKSGVQTMWFNIAYEKVGDVPKYSRATEGQLQYSSKKRPADTLLVAEEAVGVGKPVKRQRSSSKCFNCGSYGHSMRECWKELDRQAVEESRREHAEGREASGAAYRSAAKRYYLQGGAENGGRNGAEQTAGEFAGLEPGQLSKELRAALSIGPLAPPPWLHRMAELGLPPGYMEPVPAGTAGEGAAGEPAEGHAVEQPANGPAALAAGGPTAAQPQAPDGAANGAAAAAAAAAATAVAAEGPLEDYISLEDGSAGAAAEEAGEEATPAKLECVVKFPGINAPPPEGADVQAWTLPPPPQRAPSAPPGFGGSRATPPAAHWHPGSAERGSGGGRGAHWQPLRGLHPTHHAASEGSLPAAGGSAPRPPQPGWQHDHVTPPRPLHHGGSAPDLHHAPQQQALQYHQQPAQGWAAQLPQGLQGISQQYAAQHAQQLQGMQQQVQLPAPEDVYSVSRADPGHMLVYDPRAPPGQPYHWLQQQQQQPQPQAHQQPQQQQVGYYPPPPQQPQQPAQAAMPTYELPQSNPYDINPYAWQQQHQQQQQQQQQQQVSFHQQPTPPGFGYQQQGAGYGQLQQHQGYGGGYEPQLEDGYGSSNGGRQQAAQPPSQQQLQELQQRHQEQQRRLWHGDGRY